MERAKRNQNVKLRQPKQYSSYNTIRNPKIWPNKPQSRPTNQNFTTSSRFTPIPNEKFRNPGLNKKITLGARYTKLNHTSSLLTNNRGQISQKRLKNGHKVASFVGFESHSSPYHNPGKISTKAELNSSSTSASYTPRTGHQRLNSYKLPKKYITNGAEGNREFQIMRKLNVQSKGKLNATGNFFKERDKKSQPQNSSNFHRFSFSQTDNNFRKIAKNYKTQESFNQNPTNTKKPKLLSSNQIYRKYNQKNKWQSRDRPSIVKRENSQPVIRKKITESQTSITQHDEYDYESIRNIKTPKNIAYKKTPISHKFYNKKNFGLGLSNRFNKSGTSWKKKIGDAGCNSNPKRDYSAKTWKKSDSSKSNSKSTERKILIPRRPNLTENRKISDSTRLVKNLTARAKNGISQPPRISKMQHLKNLFSKYKIKNKKQPLPNKKKEKSDVKTLWRSNPTNSQYKIQKIEKLNSKNPNKIKINKKNITEKEERFSETYFAGETPKFNDASSQQNRGKFFNAPYSSNPQTRNQISSRKHNSHRNLSKKRDSRKLMKKSVYNLDKEKSGGGIVPLPPNFKYPLKLKSKYKKLLSAPENHNLSRILDFGDSPSYCMWLTLFFSEKNVFPDKRFFNNPRNFVNPELMIQFDTFARKKSVQRGCVTSQLLKNLKISNYSGDSRPQRDSLYHDLAAVVDYYNPLKSSQYHQLDEELEEASQVDLFENDKSLIDPVIFCILIIKI